MAINYKFNQWRNSGETATEISEKGYELLRSGHGMFTGEMLGNILYRHYIQGESANALCRDITAIPHQTVKAVLRGSFSPRAFNIFMEMAETEPEELDRMFKGDVSNA
ncbi:hypothetical protein [Bacillus sp. HMF5848]|uniref:hypothetical protein n=1 Tax=Bacillus sp. HMF5848 TaxID=2495421 RepID=UPI000F766FDC|nr:hypothetical protein [Bacillus sp. HMF5848]